MNKNNWQKFLTTILFQHNKPMIGKSNIQRQLLESGGWCKPAGMRYANGPMRA